MEKDTIINFLESVQQHTKGLIKEKSTTPPDDLSDKIKRGMVLWVDFGFNLGHEFGGKHPALILRYINEGQDIYVIPLDSKRLPDSKRYSSGKPKNGFIDIPKEHNGYATIKGMKKIDRWCNVYRLCCLSWLRIDFDSEIGSMHEDYVKAIEAATQKFRYKPYIPLKNKVLTKTS